MPDPAIFTQSDGGRIAKAVQYVERQPDFIRGNGSPTQYHDNNFFAVSGRNESETRFDAGDFVVINNSVWIEPTVDEDTFRFAPTLKIEDAGYYSSGVSGSVDESQLNNIYGVAITEFAQGNSNPQMGVLALGGVFATKVTGEVSVGSQVVPISEKVCRAATAGPHKVLYVESGSDLRWAIVLINAAAEGTCPYYWNIICTGGSPTTGAVIFGGEVNGDEQTITIDYNMTASELKTHIVSQFAAIGTDDITVYGGPFPNVALTIHWEASVIPEWPPSIDENTLDEGARMVVWDNPRI